MINNDQLSKRFQHIEPRFVGLLRSLNAHKVPHSKRTLAEHLVGTHDLLCAWGNNEPVCRAGLFHSIYGTRVFEIQCADFSSRKMVRGIIGESAEALAYWFCISDRDSFFSSARKYPHVIRDAVGNSDVQINRRDLASLLEIEAANIVEHLPRRGRQTRREMRWYLEAFSECRQLLSPAAFRAVTDALEIHTADPPLQATL